MEPDCPETPKLKHEGKFFRSQFFWKPVIGIILGGVAGFLFYYFIGCKTGTCSIAGNPWNSTIIGGLLGFWIAGSTCSRFRQSS